MNTAENPRKAARALSCKGPRRQYRRRYKLFSGLADPPSPPAGAL